MPADPIVSFLEKVDRRTYDMVQRIERIDKRVDFIESRVREMHDLIRYIRTNCAEEKQIDKLRDEIKSLERAVSKLR